MLIKVCGMSSEEQVGKLDGSADFIGFIFYEKSKRFVNSTSETKGALKVGVFVNESTDVVSKCIKEHALDLVQLHGDETSVECAVLKKESGIIKAFGVSESFDFARTKEYEKHVDYFLFDTKTEQYGGSGQQFDWSVLEKYKGSVPFLLSGGINPTSVKDLKEFNHPKLIGVDLNSGFENSPADKNVSQLNQFIKELNE